MKCRKNIVIRRTRWLAIHSKFSFSRKFIWIFQSKKLFIFMKIEFRIFNEIEVLTGTKHFKNWFWTRHCQNWQSSQIGCRTILFDLCFSIRYTQKLRSFRNIIFANNCEFLGIHSIKMQFIRIEEIQKIWLQIWDSSNYTSRHPKCVSFWHWKA